MSRKFKPMDFVVDENTWDDLRRRSLEEGEPLRRFTLRSEALRLSLLLPYLHGLLCAGAALFAWRARGPGFRRNWATAGGAAAAACSVATSVVYLSVDMDEWRATVFREALAPLLLATWLLTGLFLLGARNARDTRGAVLWVAAAGSVPSLGWLVWLLQCGDVSGPGENYGWYLAALGVLLLISGAATGLWKLRKDSRAGRAPPAPAA